MSVQVEAWVDKPVVLKFRLGELTLRSLSFQGRVLGVHFTRLAAEQGGQLLVLDQFTIEPV